MSSIAQLSAYRWSLPVLAALAESDGSRFVPLAHELGISRDALRRTLDALISAGFVRRNPGHGHPLRPEYVLTGAGRRAAPACAQLLEQLQRLRIESVALRKWSLPILAVLTVEHRFGELRRAVGATPRALTLALKDLVGAGLVERRVHDDFPPSTTYGPTRRGRSLRPYLDRLART